jgi:hypothetical protein
MAFKNVLFGRRDFWTEAQLLQGLAQPGAFGGVSIEAVAVPAKALKVFDTPTQRTWFLATPGRLVCVVDDLEFPTPRVQWEKVLDRDARGKLSVEIAEGDISPRWESSTGVLGVVGKREPWVYYSKKLFGKEGGPASVRAWIDVASPPQ